MLLSEIGLGKSNNLHFMRFVAALAVIFAHAFSLSASDLTGEWFMVITNGQMHMGAFAVAVFFLCGGYLIGKSVEQKNGRGFFRSRLARLIPPLLFVNIMVIVFGVLFTTLSPTMYLLNINTWKYLLNSVFILMHDLPGVFTENIYLSTVNGSLWTLPVEFLCYVACFVLYKITSWEKGWFAVSIPIVVVLAVVGTFFLPASLMPLASIIQPVIQPALLFYIGIGFWVYRDRIYIKTQYVIAALIGFVLSVVLGVMNLGMLVFFPYIMFAIWFAAKQCPEKLASLGNYSYGIYLWGFPVQQAVVSIFGGSMNPYLNTLISIPIAIAFGATTYYIAEKQFMLRISRRTDALRIK